MERLLEIMTDSGDAQERLIQTAGLLVHLNECHDGRLFCFRDDFTADWSMDFSRNGQQSCSCMFLTGNQNRLWDEYYCEVYGKEFKDTMVAASQLGYYNRCLSLSQRALFAGRYFGPVLHMSMNEICRSLHLTRRFAEKQVKKAEEIMIEAWMLDIFDSRFLKRNEILNARTKRCGTFGGYLYRHPEWRRTGTGMPQIRTNI